MERINGVRGKLFVCADVLCPRGKSRLFSKLDIFEGLVWKK